MKMNKLWAVAALTLALVSCKNEPAKEPEQQGMKFPVSLSIDGGGSGALRATETGHTTSASYPNERAVENLTVVVFTHNNTTNTPIAVEKVIAYDELTKPAGNDPYQGNYQFDMKMAGTYQLEVIANGYKDDTDKAAFIGKFPVGMSYEEFKKVVFDRALPNHGEKGFAMLSTEPVKVITAANTTTNAGTIRLRRLACRFDVFNKLVDELKLTKVTLQNQTVKSYMMTQVAVPTGADGGAKEYTQAANNTWFKPTVVSGGIYSYENPTKGAVKLQLEGEYNGKAWEKTIELLDKDGNYVATQRNHIYRVLLTKGNGSTPGGGDEKDKDNITYNIEVLDWDEDSSFDYTDDDVMDAERINPLAYVAEYNINTTGDGFVTDLYATDLNGYYPYNIAVQKFSRIKIGGKAYHLPSFDEWKSIMIPYNDGNAYYYNDLVAFFPIVQEEPREYSYSQNVELLGAHITCIQDIKTVMDHKDEYQKGIYKAYALRFKGTKYLSAWKYEFVVRKFKTDDEQVIDLWAMKITSRNVTDKVNIKDVTKESFWQQDSADDIVRIFPASGFNGDRTHPLSGNAYGMDGWYPSATILAETNVALMGFGVMGYVTSGHTYFTTNSYTIRLFEDKP